MEKTGMTWEQKLEAIQALSSSAQLVMRKSGDWYVHTGVSRGGDGLLASIYDNGSTPQEAVENTFAKLINIPSDRYLVVQDIRGRRHYRWAGFMWKELAR
jgi:hypothetical protein